MPLRALKTEEEIAGIPLDQEILIELPSGVDDLPEPKTEKLEPSDPDAKKLMEQLEAAQAAQKAQQERADKAERDAADARKLADQRAREHQEALKRATSLESDVINGGLSAAQNELAAAKAELQRAGEAGDWKAMAEAQARIARSSAQVVSLESGAAEIAERKEQAKVEPRQEQPRAQDPIAAIDSNPQLLPAEKEWLKAHPDAVMDQRRNNELSVGYDRAMKKGLVRGTPAYFAELEDFMGYKQPELNNGEPSVQAPVTRMERGGDGRPSQNTIRLTPEQREIAKNMGVSDIEYAKQVAAFEAARKADPDKYRGG